MYPIILLMVVPYVLCYIYLATRHEDAHLPNKYDFVMAESSDALTSELAKHNIANHRYRLPSSVGRAHDS